MAKGTHRDAEREARWRRIIREQARSALTIRRFCRENDLAESAFYFWRRELQRREALPEQRQRTGRTDLAEGQIAAPAFVPVSISQQARPEAPAIEIALPGGARIHVGAGVDRQALADVVAVLLEARAC